MGAQWLLQKHGCSTRWASGRWSQDQRDENSFDKSQKNLGVVVESHTRANMPANEIRVFISMDRVARIDSHTVRQLGWHNGLFPYLFGMRVNKVGLCLAYFTTRIGLNIYFFALERWCAMWSCTIRATSPREASEDNRTHTDTGSGFHSRSMNNNDNNNNNGSKLRAKFCTSWRSLRENKTAGLDVHTHTHTHIECARDMQEMRAAVKKSIFYLQWSSSHYYVQYSHFLFSR